MASPDLIVIAGAPGSGKSTLMSGLARRLVDVPRIEFSDLREWHLDPAWERQTEFEEDVAFKNLVLIVENYVRHGMTPVLVTDLREKRVDGLARLFDGRIAVLTLIADASDIRRRVGARLEGFTDVDAAVAWNNRLQAAAPAPCERRLDSSTLSAEELLTRAAELLWPDR